MEKNRSLIRFIKKELNDDQVLRKLREKKFFLLSEYEKRLLNIYFKDNRLVKYKKCAIQSICNRIILLDDEKLNYYLNHLEKIMHKKIELKTKIGTIKDIDFKMPTKTVLKEKPKSMGRDFYFNYLVDTENYDELFNLYDIETIERDTNIFEKRDK